MKTKPKGQCLFCKRNYTKSGISRHLQTHLDKKEKKNNAGKSFLVKVEPNPRYSRSNPYFLLLWIDDRSKMGELDDFLRAIWLECCGHMSSFADPAKRREGGGMWNFLEAQSLLEKGKMSEYEQKMEDANGEVAMSRKASKVLYKGLKLNYQYDFGSTTDLMISVISEYACAADESIVLLSRNEIPDISCDICKQKPAALLAYIEYDEERWFCNSCSREYDKEDPEFEDYPILPVVNSPRMGVCGYTGGHIDVERDRIPGVNPYF